MNAHVSLLIDGTEEKSRCAKSRFRKPVTKGVGDFVIKLSNAGGQKSGTYVEGNTVKFYADNNDGTALKFWGRIDYVKELVGKGGQFLEIEGRHRGYLSSETEVCKDATGTECGTLLKELITDFLSVYGFTSTNVSVATGKTMDVNWNYKPFWECVIEICNYAGYDCYIDDDLDFHFFAVNSTVCTDDAVVEGHTFLKMSDWGKDTYYEKTRVIGVGIMSDGITPIIYTAIDPSEGIIKREVSVIDVTANTLAQVQAIAEAKLDQLTDIPPQARVNSHFLETAIEGDNLWYSIKRHKIHSQYKIIELIHEFGMNVGGIRTETVIEKEIKGTSEVMEERVRNEQRITYVINPNKLDFSYNFEFDDETNLGTQTNVLVDEGYLKLTGTTGTMITNTKNADNTITKCELRHIGSDLGATTISVSCQGGGSWVPLTRNVKTDIPAASQGKKLQIKVDFAKNGNNTNPRIATLAVLFS